MILGCRTTLSRSIGNARWRIKSNGVNAIVDCPREKGNHRIRMTFADADGKLVMPAIDSSIGVRFGPEDTSTTANLVLNIQQIKLERFGEYTIDIAVDGRQEGSIPLYVRKQPEPQL